MSTGIINHNYEPDRIFYTQGHVQYPNPQFQNLQYQVNEVTDIMRNNIQLELQRGMQLDDLQTRAEDLNNTSQQFAYRAHQVQRKFWWQNVKMWIIVIIVVIIVITLIVVLSVLAAKNKI